MNIMERNAAAYAVYCATGNGGENIDRVIEILDTKRFRSNNPLLDKISMLSNFGTGKTMGAVRRLVRKALEETDEQTRVSKDDDSGSRGDSNRAPERKR